MTSLDGIMGFLVSVFFLFNGVTKIFSYRRKSSFLESGIIETVEVPASASYPYWCMFLLGVLEVAAALALITPAALALVAAIFLATLTAASVVFRVRRQQSAAPTIALFLMVLFVILGRWI